MPKTLVSDHERAEKFEHYPVHEQDVLKVPVAFFQDDRFRSMSTHAKFLYSWLLDRTTNLSQKNNWIDDKGRFFVHYANKELASYLNLGESTIRKRMDELREIGLIKTVRIGQGNPNRIYVMTFW